MSLADRVCRRGGGIGRAKMGLPLPRGDGGGTVAAMLLKMLLRWEGSDNKGY